MNNSSFFYLTKLNKFKILVLKFKLVSIIIGFNSNFSNCSLIIFQYSAFAFACSKYWFGASQFSIVFELRDLI
jgi:hypothetical protein